MQLLLWRQPFCHAGDVPIKQMFWPTFALWLNHGNINQTPPVIWHQTLRLRCCFNIGQARIKTTRFRWADLDSFHICQSYILLKIPSWKIVTSHVLYTLTEHLTQYKEPKSQTAQTIKRTQPSCLLSGEDDFRTFECAGGDCFKGDMWESLLVFGGENCETLSFVCGGNKFVSGGNGGGMGGPDESCKQQHCYIQNTA